MKRTVRRALALAAALCMLLPLASCGSGGQTADKTFLYGVNYSDSQMSDRLSVAQVSFLSQALGAKSTRLCVDIMESGTTIFADQGKRLHDMLSAMTLSGMERVVVQLAGFPLEGTVGYTAPYPDLEDDEYTAFLDEVSEMVAVLAKEFPEVGYWQIGHLLNRDLFLHPVGWREEDSPVDPFTPEEKAAVTVDVQYRIVKALRDAGSEAVVVMADIADVEKPETATYLKAVYDAIASGNHGSKNVEDFFDVLAWNPALTQAPGDAFVEANDALYSIVKQAKDGGRHVYLTEMGTESEDETAQSTHAQWLKDAYALAAEKLPYVESLFWYRLFNDGEESYGLMNEPRGGFAPTQKGQAFQSAAGGEGDLERYVIREDQYTSGDNVALSVPTKASSSCEHPGWGWSLAGVNNGTLDNSGWSNYYELGEGDWITSPTGGGSNDYNRPEWVEFYLPYSWEIDKVLLYPRNELDENFHQVMGLPRQVLVEVSDDGETWTKVGELKVMPKTYSADVTNLTRAENPPLEISFDPVKTKNVRVSFPQLSTNWQHVEGQYFVQLYEIEILMH